MLYFELQNIRVFEESTLFQTTPNKKQTRYNQIYLKKQYMNKNVDILPFSVIYGANASGKSTLIKAMALLKEIVLTGRIVSDIPSTLLYNIGLFPFLHDYNKYISPMKLAIGFIYNKNKYEYSLKMEFKMPYEEYKVERKIVEETLYVNDKEKFYRKNNIILFDGGATKKEIGNDEAIRPDELFLYGSFKSTISTHKYYQDIIDWFRNNFAIIFDVNSLNINIEYPSLPLGSSVKLKNKIIDAALNAADFGPQSLYYVLNNENGNQGLQMRSSYSINGKNINLNTNALNTESNGTIKLVELTLLITGALSNGSTVVIDELDTSFHVAIIKDILSLFCNKNLNKNGAHLIFSSHNFCFMNLMNIRKDQIYLVEKNETTHTSSLYSLADFRTNSETDVRNGEKYIKNYFEGKYGAFPKSQLDEAIDKYFKSIESTTTDKD